jgi:signal transduction histidine kinase
MEPVMLPRRGFWLSRFSPRQIDLTVVVLGLVTSFPEVRHGKAHAIGFVMMPIAATALWWRRAHPGAVLGVVAAAFMIGAIFGGAAAPGGAFVFAMYAASRYGSQRVRMVAVGVAVGTLIAAFSIVLATGEARQLGHLAGPAFGSGVAWAVGDRNRNRRAYLDQLEERAKRAEQEREENARRAMEQERNRIARELHDVVAHNVSVIAVQAGAARTTAANDPARALQALGLVEQTARTTLSELRALLGVLRKDDTVSLTPQPTLRDLGTLIRQTGLAVDTHIEGDVRPLPAVVELCAYRVVQEALTNVIKHAPGAKADVRIDYEPSWLAIDVTDDGPGPNATDGGGHGLLGMRERVELLGGRMRTGRGPRGGFSVDVRIPLGDA